MSGAHIHPLSGFLPSLTVFGVVIPIYFLVVSISFIVALIVLVKRADRLALSRNRALDIALVIMVSGFIGSRLFHVVFEEPAYYAQAPWRIFDIWRGGFVWYGGALAAVVSSLVFVSWKRLPLGPWLDLFAPIAALGYALGRVACVLTGCCYGRVFVWQGVSYRHPTQSYAVAWELAVFATLLLVERARFFKKPGSLFLLWAALHACGRLVMEAFRDDDRGPLVLGLSVSTVISLAILIAVGAIALLNRRSQLFKRA